MELTYSDDEKIEHTSPNEVVIDPYFINVEKFREPTYAWHQAMSKSNRQE